MGPEGLLPSSKQPVTCSCSEAAISSPRPLYVRSFLILPSHLCLGLLIGLFRSDFPSKLSTVHDTYPACRAYWSSVEQTNRSVQEKERKGTKKERNKQTNEQGRYRLSRKRERNKWEKGKPKEKEGTKKERNTESRDREGSEKERMEKKKNRRKRNEERQKERKLDR